MRRSLFLLAGQSNTSGHGVVEAKNNVVDPRVRTLNAANEWVPAADPIRFDKPSVAGVGLVRSFPLSVVDATARPACPAKREKRLARSREALDDEHRPVVIGDYVVSGPLSARSRGISNRPAVAAIRD